MAELGFRLDAHAVPAAHGNSAVADVIKRVIKPVRSAAGTNTLADILIGLGLLDLLEVAAGLELLDAGRAVEGRMHLPFLFSGFWAELHGAVDNVFRGCEVLTKQEARRHEAIPVADEAMGALVARERGRRVGA